MANNKIQVKRTSVSGRTANVTSSGNSQYIDAGELALNMADGILYSSNGSSLITVGANLVNQRISNSLTIDSNKALRFQTVNTSAVAYFIQQNDDNFVFYTTNTSYGARPVYSIFANSDSSEFSFSTPVRFNGNVTALTANGSAGAAGQVLTSNGSTVYWSSVGGTGTVTSVATGNGMTGGPITTSGTVSVLANTGIVANATGVYVNATYIGTISANNASFLGGTAAASYVQNTDSRTLSGNLVFSGANVNFTGNARITGGLIANGGLGTAADVLTSNGSSVYWAPVSGGSSNAVYMKGGAATIGTLAAGGSNIFRVNANTLSYDTTIASGENAQATGPLAIASGITLTISSGARVAIS